MKIKNKIHNVFLKNEITQKIYKGISYVKWKLYYGVLWGMPIVIYKLKKRRPVFLIFTPEHANLGDHAIAYAEERMLKSLKFDYFEITGKQLGRLQAYGYLKLLNNAMVIVNGGGNLGTLWPDIEQMNRCIISELKKSTICIMPNSIYYGENYQDKLEFEKSIQIYNSHPSLYMYAREELSYKTMKKVYKNVKLMPDMVLNLNECVDKTNRKGCLLCMRNDVEKTVNGDDYIKICEQLKNIFGTITITNTVLDYDVSRINRKKELAQKFSEFRNAELVVTDRLHGMIFCAITGTNCIVLNGKSPKIKGCFRWIEDLGYIMLIEKAENLTKAYQELKKYPHYYENEKIQLMYLEMKKEIYNLVVNGKW